MAMPIGPDGVRRPRPVLGILGVVAATIAVDPLMMTSQGSGPELERPRNPEAEAKAEAKRRRKAEKRLRGARRARVKHQGSLEVETFGESAKAVCNCGWHGPERADEDVAMDDLMAHYGMVGA